jgi:hypothetical protein
MAVGRLSRPSSIQHQRRREQHALRLHEHGQQKKLLKGGTKTSSKSMDNNCHSNPPQHCVSNNTLWPVSTPALWGSTSYTRSPPGRGRTSCSTRAPDSAAAPSTWSRHEDESSPGARPGRTRYVSRKVRTWGGTAIGAAAVGRWGQAVADLAVVDSLLQARSSTCSLCPAPHPPPRLPSTRVHNALHMRTKA